MKMNTLLEQITERLEGELNEDVIQRQYIYDVVFCIRKRCYAIKHIDFDYHNYEWNISLIDTQSEEYKNREVSDTTKLSLILRRYNFHKERFSWLLHKDVHFIYSSYGYKYEIQTDGLRVKDMRVSKLDSQVIYYFD